MAGTMSEADLVADLGESLFDTAAVFKAEGDATLKRLLRESLPDMQVKRPLTKVGQITLDVDVATYAVAEADFAAFKTDLWRDQSKLPKPWAPTWPGALPRIQAARGGDGWTLLFDPAPTAAHLSVLGTVCKYWYFAEHVIGADAADTTVAAQDRGLLLVRAQAQVMLALAMRNASKPVTMRDGVSGVARNSTPAALYDALMQVFREAR